MSALPKLIIITGATAAGKSAFIYEHLSGLPLTVINADSRQVYRDIQIASASPAARERAMFAHALYNFLPVAETFSAGAFMRAAKDAIAASHGMANIPLLCGGTYFYLHALLYGLLPHVDVNPDIAARVEAMPAAEAYAELQRRDKVAAAQNHPHNVVRVKRALMLCMAVAGPISTMAKTGGIAGDSDILMMIFDMDRALLRQRTAQRVSQMFEAGLIREAEALVAAAQQSGDIKNWRKTPALTGIGVREFFEAFDVTGKMPAALSAEELKAVEKGIAQNTIHLVKRQQTWYRNAAPKPVNTKTVDPSYENVRIAALVKEFIG